MSVQHDNSRTFIANEAMTQFRRVLVHTDGGVKIAGNTVVGVGILQRDTVQNDTYGAVVRFRGTGSFKIACTAAPVTAGDLLYAAANGMAAPTGTVSLTAFAAENLASNGGVIEAIPSFV